MKPDQTNRLMLAVVLSLAILLGYEWLASVYHLRPAPVATAEATAAAQTVTPVPETTNVVPSAKAEWVMLENDVVQASVNPAGSRIDKWILRNEKQYHSDTLGYPQLTTEAVSHTEYVESGWLGAGVKGPDATATWRVKEATPLRAVLEWMNDSGQTFTRTLTLEGYQLLVQDAVHNNADLPVSLTPYMQVHRADGDRPNEMASFVNFIGPMGVTAEGDDVRLHETYFKDLKKDKIPSPMQGQGGWWGITSQYFMTAIVPPDGASTRAFRHAMVGGHDVYTASVEGVAVVVPPRGSAVSLHRMYAGPKKEELLLAVGSHLERAIDWGWFRAIARPFHTVLLWLHGWVGNWGVAIFLLTLALKIVTYPLSNKSYHAMAKMKKLQPQMEAMKERFKDDQQGMALEMMKLYQREKVNPLSGCWPMVIQIPIFFAMYKVILLAFEFRHAPLGLWIHDLSLADPWFVLPVLMGISMWVQQKLNPPPTDPAQAMVFKWMPIMFTVMFLWFPAALVFYWLVNNILGIAQQWMVMRQDGVKVV